VVESCCGAGKGEADQQPEKGIDNVVDNADSEPRVCPFAAELAQAQSPTELEEDQHPEEQARDSRGRND
jgi:hypothetical protein